MPVETRTLKQAVITYPAEIPAKLNLSDQQFTREFLFLGAAKLFELGHLSSGTAARLAGMDRVSFLYELGRIGVPAINLRDEELEAEILAAKVLA
jgi:predicted HTH domain antitoxin